MICGLLLAATLAASATPAGPQRPKLVVMVVVDQLSNADFESKLPRSHAGFARLMREGFRFNDARYESVPPFTAPGHTTLATGAYPEVHGIIANEWYMPKLGRIATSVEDPTYRVLLRNPMEGDGTAPSYVHAGSLGQALKARFPGAKVVGVAAKDRSAILFSGPNADLALWLDHAAPSFTSSTYYLPSQGLPSWVNDLNQRMAKEGKGVFELPLPRGGFTGKAAEDLAPASVRAHAHPDSPSMRALNNPALEHWVVELALAAVKGMALGQDDRPDLLTVSFSTYDYTLHAHGPDSDEALLAFDRIDEELGRLLDGLDRALGKGGYVLALAADHGGAHAPEVAKTAGLDGGRVDGDVIQAMVEKLANQKLGKARWFEGFRGTGLFADPKNVAKLHKLDDAIAEVGRSVAGVRELWPKSLVLQPTTDPVMRLYRHGVDAERSPDFILVTQPYWLVGARDFAEHGSWHLYDRQIPLIFFGAGVRHGEGEHAESIDVAPTLARLAGSPPPCDAEGHVLNELMAPTQLR